MSALKLFIMKEFFTAQEILLVTNSKFAAKEYIKKDEGQPGPKRPITENLAEACWNGMLGEMLPELYMTENKKPLRLWELGEGNHLFYLKLGVTDIRPDAEWTINPYRFADHVVLN
jgi:hypothetical protein